jgi:acetyl esterase/lipase
VKRNIAKYGGDPQQVFLIGHSAGAYLAALLVLDPRYLAAHELTPGDVRGVVPVAGFFYVDRPGVAPDRPKDTWGTDVKVWKAASPGTYVRRGVPPMLLLYADGDDEWRQTQQSEFATALRDSGSRDVEVRMIKGRTHNTVWSEMGKGEEDTSRAILQFVNRLIKAKTGFKDFKPIHSKAAPVRARISNQRTRGRFARVVLSRRAPDRTGSRH